MRSVGRVLISLATSEPCAALPDTPSNSQSTACPETSTISTRVLKNRFFSKSPTRWVLLNFCRIFLNGWRLLKDKQTWLIKLAGILVTDGKQYFRISKNAE